MNATRSDWLWLLWLMAFPLRADLLADDEFDYQSDSSMQTAFPATEHAEAKPKASVWAHLGADSRVTLSQSLAQDERMSLLRTRVQWVFERALWRDSYLHLDTQYTRYAPEDALARAYGDDFGDSELQALWLQQSLAQCAVKLGRQQVFWGQVEGAFAVDVLMPFDFSEPLLTEFVEVRRAQDMALLDCYGAERQIQLFYVPKATFDRYHPRPNAQLEELEDSLQDEWGLRFKQRINRLELTVFAAHLYHNTPTIVFDPLSMSGLALRRMRYDMLGSSLSWAQGKWLWELDLAWKSDQQLFRGDAVNIWDAALGFEYLSAGNHQFSFGLILTEAGNSSGQALRLWHALSASWSRHYLHDDLALSVLGYWREQGQQSNTTMQAQYKLDDYWTLVTAVGYQDIAANDAFYALFRLPPATTGWQLNTRLELTF